MALFALALLIGLPSAAQEPLTGEELAARQWDRDCIYPDLRYNPDFHICGRHLLDGDRESIAVTSFSGVTLYVKLRDHDDGATWPGRTDQVIYESWLQFGVWPQGALSTRPIAGVDPLPGHAASATRRIYQASVGVVVVGRDLDGGGWNRNNPANRIVFGPGIRNQSPSVYFAADSSCNRDPDCYAEFPWYVNQWRELTAEQVRRVARVIQINQDCAFGINAAGSLTGYDLQLRLFDSGRIGGSCVEVDTDATGLVPRAIQGPSVIQGPSLLPEPRQNWGWRVANKHARTRKDAQTRTRCGNGRERQWRIVPLRTELKK